MPTALVIDDARQLADLLCQMLSLLGVDAHPAYGPRAAMFTLKGEVPDIVFLDISMPGVDGFEVMTYLLREPRLDQVPIVVVTADDSPATVQKALEFGAMDVIIKPATLNAVEKALKAANLV